jgi:hypothetical protein
MKDELKRIMRAYLTGIITRDEALQALVNRLEMNREDAEKELEGHD